MGKITYRVLQPTNLFAFADDRVAVKEKVDNAFHIGGHYTFADVEYINNEPQYVFELIAYVKEVNGIAIDSLIVKPIKIPDCSVFTLSRLDCETFGIEFQDGLMLYSSTLQWKELNAIEDKDYDDDDLSTYPINKNDRMIHHMILRLTQFTQINDSFIKTPYGTTILLQDFLKSLSINIIDVSILPQNCSQQSISGVVATSKLCKNYGNFDIFIVDNTTRSIFIEIDFTMTDMSNNKTFGIQPQSLRGKKINDIIQVTWIEDAQKYMENWNRAQAYYAPYRNISFKSY